MIGTFLPIKNNTLNEGKGLFSSLGMSIVSIVKATPGRVCTVSVTTAGSGLGKINDAASSAQISTTNVVAEIPSAIGIYLIDFPVNNGIMFTPGAGGQVASISYT